MTKRMLIDAVRPEETRVVIVGDHNRIEEFDFITSAKSQVKGNIYLAKITRVEPSLQAAFVEYGGDKQGFLSFSEIHPDYYQIPIADRKRLIEEMERQIQEDAEREARREQEEEARGARSDRNEGAYGDGDADAAEPEEGEQGGRPRGRHRSRRRTFGARARDAKDENAAERVTQSDVIEEAQPPAQEAADTSSGEDNEAKEAAAAAAPSVEHMPSGEALEAAPQEAQPAATVAEGDVEPAEKPNTLDTNSDEDTIERARKTTFSKRYRIQEVIKRGQIVLVQVIKEERGNKGVSLTTYISLAGRYCVLMPNASKDGGISRKVGKNDERKRLREIASELKESCGMSVIIRTAGLGRTKVEVKRDHEYLVKLWNLIREDALSSTAPALIYEESDILKRSIRDYYDPEIEEILVQGEAAHKNAKEFMKLIMPSHAARVKLYKEDTPILSDFRVESQLEEMYQPIAKLRSGGYIVLNHTEALISVDVNSGRSTSERNVEETALKTNLEAAREVARQLRLRDLGGLIVVDFIDMFYGKNRRSVERAFKDALRADRAKIQVGHISPFGLLELSRQRLRPSISETTTLPCPHCQGTGSIRSNESVAIEIVRALEREASSGQFRELRVTVSTETALHMLNHTRGYLSELEEKFDVNVVIKADHGYLSSQYGIEKIRRPSESGSHRQEGERKPHSAPRHHKENHEAAAEEEHTPDQESGDASKEEGAPRRRRSRGGRGRGRRRGNDRQQEAFGENEGMAAEGVAQVVDDLPPPLPAEEAPQEAPQEAATKEAVYEDAAEMPEAADSKKKPAARSKAAKTAKPRAGAETSPARRKTPAAKKPAAKKAETPEAKKSVTAAKPASTTASAAVTTEEPAPSGPARKGWWSKVMS